MLLYKVISSATDYAELQQDIDRIYGWSTANLMTFNSSKCKCMLVSQKRNANCPPMNLNNHQLVQVQCYGLLLSTDLSWSHHIETTCTKARKLLGLLYRQFFNNTNPQVMAKLFLSLVRPHLEYRSQVWHPHLIRDKNALEWSEVWVVNLLQTIDCKLLDLFQLHSLENQRLFLSLSSF